MTAIKSQFSLLLGLAVLILTKSIECRPQSELEAALRGEECTANEKASGEPKPCKFPFIFRNETYYGCTTNTDPDGLAWCSTDVNPLTYEHIDGKGKWGHCSANCAADEVAKEAHETLGGLERGALLTNRQIIISECGCTSYSECDWSIRIIGFIQRLPKQNPTRTSMIRFVRERICDADSLSVLCCSGDDAPSEDQVQDFKQKNQAPSNQQPSVQESNQNLGTWKPDGGSQECGLRAGTRNIVGGTQAKFGELPFIALFGYFRDTTQLKAGIYYECGGSLINKWYVITAAHCVEKSEPSEIVLGEHIVGPDPDCEAGCPQAIIRKPQKIIIHEGYDSDKYNNDSPNDIALIRLDEPVPLYSEDKRVSAVSPVCLPWLSTSPGATLNPGDRVLGAGWGRTTNNRQIAKAQFLELMVSTRTLLKVELPVAEGEKCAKDPTYRHFIDETQLCVGGELGKDSCNGDSGGPIAIREATDKPWYQVGIVSYGASVCGSDHGAVYTKITAFLPWIQSKLEP